MRLATELERAQASGCIGPQKGAVDDKLLTLIKRYEADLQEIHAFPDIPDEMLDAMMERSLERLTEVIDVPSLTATSTLAALSLLAEELIKVPENPDEQTNYELCMGALISAVRGYVASTAAE